jgi:hypothetical protein
MATPAEIREALRKLHVVSPEEAAGLERHLEEQENQLLLYSSEDAFKAFVLAQAQQSGVIQGLLQRIDSSILSPLAAAEADKAQTALVISAAAAEKALTVRQVITQPVVLAIIAVLSALLTTFSTVILHLVGVS